MKASKKKQGAGEAFELKIVLEDLAPPVWRRLAVLGSDTFHQLHLAIQAAMGWENYHLYSFDVAGRQLGDPAASDELPFENARRVRLDALLEPGVDVRYEYDFGDSWEHTIRVERVTPVVPGVALPRCVAGARACPPEDVGGTSGYAEFLEALADPEHERHTEFREWIGRSFVADAFDVDEANARLRKARRQGK